MRPNWLSTTPAQKKPRICGSIWGARRVSTGRAIRDDGGGEEDGGEILHWAGLDDAEGGDDEDRDAEEGERVEAQVVDHLDGAAGQVHVHPRARRPEAPPPLRPVPGRPTHAAEDAAGRRRGGRGGCPGGGGRRRGEEDVEPCPCQRRRRRSGSRRHGAKAGGARAEATGTEAERLASRRVGACAYEDHRRARRRCAVCPCRVPARAGGVGGVPFIWLRAGPGEGELGGLSWLWDGG